MIVLMMLSALFSLGNSAFSDKSGQDLTHQQMIDQCAFTMIADALGDGDFWHDLRPVISGDPQFADHLHQIMPDYKLAYVHELSNGLLLIGGDRLKMDSLSGDQGAGYWTATAADTRKACAEAGLECSVSLFSEAPYGLAASTFIAEGSDAVRRETLAFIGADRCAYAIQFSGPVAAITDQDWSELQLSLLDLRGVVQATETTASLP
ncbi:MULTISPECIES: hypothetical protein [unclassified Iodidimonas]|jgi:hypothetical protein|uniref:hypothetical protein n=1 Tax=unclassified Iodidimonas TaxID=2626145 RepID=UPI0024832B97|nr:MULTISPECIES: hypothetical protein [unclassified Iodidimonas]